MTLQRSHSKKRWNDGFLTNRNGKNINLKKYLPLIGCWVVLALLLVWFVSNDLVSAKQAVDHQCEQVQQVKPDLQRWRYLTNHQLFSQ